MINQDELTESRAYVAKAACLTTAQSSHRSRLPFLVTEERNQ